MGIVPRRAQIRTPIPGGSCRAPRRGTRGAESTLMETFAYHFQGPPLPLRPGVQHPFGPKGSAAIASLQDLCRFEA